TLSRQYGQGLRRPEVGPPFRSRRRVGLLRCFATGNYSSSDLFLGLPQNGMSSSAAPPPTGAVSKSPVSIGTSLSVALTLLENPFPLPPASSPRPPRNCTVSAMISIDSRFCPSLVSHWLHSSRPSMATGRPFFRYCAQLSACRPNTVTRKKFGFSSQFPVSLFLRRVLTAIPNLQIERLPAAPSSGSLVRLPVSTTLLIFTVGAPFQDV